MNHEYFLLQALQQAKIRQGFCAPNPSVGAVIVSAAGEVLATGYHLGAGHPHAEVDALAKLNGRAPGATIYVTLEPCCHWGRTPPCTDAIVRSGIKHVVYGLTDPNPIVSGKGQAILARENITSEKKDIPEITEFYRSYSHWQRTKKPYITAKIAMSLDGKIAHTNGRPIQITGPALKELTYQYRKQSDAILTTAKTIICDDPQMNVRSKEIIAKPIYILDRELKLPLNAKIFSTAKSITIFHGRDVTAQQIERFSTQQIRCIGVEVEQNRLNLPVIIEQIGQDGVHDLWIEAGGMCFAAFAEQKLLQQMLIYLAPCWLGAGLNAFANHFSLDISAAKIHWQPVGNDVVLHINKS